MMKSEAQQWLNQTTKAADEHSEATTL